MFENNAKGWYGSYSVIGRNLVQRFALILKKDEILSGNIKKNFYGDYFTTIEDTNIQEEENSKNNKSIDIFSDEYDKMKEEQIKIQNEVNMVKNANLCAPLCLAEKERYKFHQHHHKEVDRNLRKKNINFISYHPKMDFIWKKIITGPKWKFLKGRDLINIDNNSSKKNNNNNNKGKNKQKRNSVTFLTDYTFKSIPMNKQTKRGILPVNYDSRIRTDVPFLQKNFMLEKNSKLSKSKNNTRSKSKNKTHYIASNTLNKLEVLKTSSNNNRKNIKTYYNTFRKPVKLLDIDKKFNLFVKKSSQNNIFKKTCHSSTKDMLVKKLDKDTFNRTIDFSKILPRNNNVFVLKKVDDTVPPFSNPSYKLTEPRCISMVSYSKNVRDEIIPKKFEGIDPQLFLEPSKYIDFVNNHKKVSVPNFDIMSGRNQNKGPLPAYMINLWDRRAIETMTDKGLKMNNYANSTYHTGNFSIFTPKKSFNKMINLTIMKNDNDKIEEELKNINEEVFGNKKLKKLIQTYAKDGKDYSKEQIKFDVISLKSFQKERKKHKKINYPLDYQF